MRTRASRQVRVVAVLSLFLTFGLGGCSTTTTAPTGATGSSSQDESPPGDVGANTPVSSDCLNEWQSFADIDDLHDTLEDAVPTLFACSSFEEWRAGGESVQGHSLLVIKTTARNLCRYQAGAEGAPVCDDL
jgi:hypothetical protein